jgi:hypothetical protein
MHGRQRVPLRFSFAPHPRDVVANFVVACVVAHVEAWWMRRGCLSGRSKIRRSFFILPLFFLLVPGTELAFEKEVECDASFRFLPTRKSPHKVARFRQVNLNRPAAHHDALEFPDGKIVLVTDLCEGQHATVLQLPSTRRPATEPGEQVMPERASLIA